MESKFIELNGELYSLENLVKVGKELNPTMVTFAGISASIQRKNKKEITPVHIPHDLKLTYGILETHGEAKGSGESFLGFGSMYIEGKMDIKAKEISISYQTEEERDADYEKLKEVLNA